MGTNKGFNLAFGITAYDANREPIEDPRLGRVVAKIVSWGFSETQGVDIGGEIPVHRCTEEEIGIGEHDKDKSKFYTLHENSYKDTAFYAKKLYCFDNEVEIQGDYNSEKAKVLKITFEKCNNQTLRERKMAQNNITADEIIGEILEEEEMCYSEDVIEKWLVRKFILTI